MSEEKKPIPMEKSLGYIAWSLKDIHAELKKLNEAILTLTKKDLF